VVVVQTVAQQQQHYLPTSNRGGIPFAFVQQQREELESPDDDDVESILEGGDDVLSFDESDFASTMAHTTSADDDVAHSVDGVDSTESLSSKTTSTGSNRKTNHQLPYHYHFKSKGADAEKKMYHAQLQQMTCHDLIREARRICYEQRHPMGTLYRRVYSCRFTTDTPSGATPHSTTPDSPSTTNTFHLPMIYHACRVLHYLTHENMMMALQRRRQQQQYHRNDISNTTDVYSSDDNHAIDESICAAFELMDRLVREEATYMATKTTNTTNTHHHHHMEGSSEQYQSKADTKLQRANHRLVRNVFLSPVFINIASLRWKDQSLLALLPKPPPTTTITNIRGGSTTITVPSPAPKLSSSSSPVVSAIPSPKELFSKLQTWTSLLIPPYATKRIPVYDINVINMVMEVIIKQQQMKTGGQPAPIVAESLLNFIIQQQEPPTFHDLQHPPPDPHDPEQLQDSTTTTTTTTDGFHLQPNSFTYGLILTAWAQSNLIHAGERMEVLVDQMRNQHHIMPTSVTYGILLRHYATRGDMEHIERIYQQMIEENIRPQPFVLMNLIFCYCKAGYVDRASAVMYQLLNLGAISERTAHIQ
jgi:pentatricopeptide repeat protein